MGDRRWKMGLFVYDYDWPPKTCPRPFELVAPRRDRCPLTRGNSKGARGRRVVLMREGRGPGDFGCLIFDFGLLEIGRNCVKKEAIYVNR